MGLKLGTVGVRREAHKLVVSNVSEKWYRPLQFLGVLVSVTELGIATFGAIVAVSGGSFNLPFVTLVLAGLLFIELGRPDIEIEYDFSYTSPPMSIGPGGQSSWNHDPPIGLIDYEYLDEDGNPIPDDELGLHGSDTVRIEIPNGNLKMMVESGEASFGMELPYHARKLTLSGEEETYEFDNLGENEERTLAGVEDLKEVLTRDEATVSFDIDRKDLFSLGRVFRVDAADGSKSIELVSTEDEIEYRYSQEDYAHTVRSEKGDLPPKDQYEVSLQWSPGQLGMHIGPPSSEQR